MQYDTCVICSAPWVAQGILSGSVTPCFVSSQPGVGETGTESYFFFFPLLKPLPLTLNCLKQTGIFLTHDMKVTIIGYITIIEFALLLQVDLCGKSMFLQLSRYAAMPY